MINFLPINTTETSNEKRMSVDIRLYTRAIVRKNNEYLQCKSGMFGGLVWCQSPYQAWWTRNADDARNVARVTGGTAMLFNPIVGKVKVL